MEKSTSGASSIQGILHGEHESQMPLKTKVEEHEGDQRLQIGATGDAGIGDEALQVIVLGPTGGPREDSVTGFLVRSLSTAWRPDSVIAVDAGTLLCGLIHILETNADNGPFAGMDLPSNDAKANAAHILRETIGSILLTHPHLDHFSGFVINSPILEATSFPKTVAGLPSVISAIKNHVFNDVMWPNLSDEDGGVGLITFQRLAEGGNPRLGRERERGYIRACDGLMTRCFAVSHGHCKQHYQPESEMHRRLSSAIFGGDPMMMRSSPAALPMRRESPGFLSPGFRQQSHPREQWSPVESSAFFIRDPLSGREIIIFGDVEPDSISFSPGNKRIWETAAPRILSRDLRAIFIECSYDDSVADESLYGHLCPRHLIAEMNVLAHIVTKLKYPGQDIKKRKRSSVPGTDEEPPSPKSKAIKRGESLSGLLSTYRSTRSRGKVILDTAAEALGTDNPIDTGHKESSEGFQWPGGEKPLQGLTVYLIHIKDDMNGGPASGDRILSQLRHLADENGLGCEFRVPQRGESFFI